MRWGMVINLRRCIGCGSCSFICDATNRISFNTLRRVFDCGVSNGPQRTRLCIPLSCMHCGKPPCLEVCPTAATYRRTDGIVDIRASRCIGCGYCVVACPYMVRSIVNTNEYTLEHGALGSESKADSPDRLIGTCTKCNFCLPRVDSGRSKGLQPGTDYDATPACVTSCAAKALTFGDLDEPESNVSRLIRENKTVLLQEEFGTDPSVYYIVDE